MSYPLFLARKLSLGSDGHKSSPAVKVATAAIALSVLIMIISVSIVLGFKREIREKIRGFNSDITLFSYPESDNSSPFVELPKYFKESLESTPGVVSSSVVISSPAILKTPNDFKGIYLRSANSPQTRSFLEANLEYGTIPDYESEENNLKVLISRKTANQLDLDTGYKIDTYFITDDIRVRRMQIAGIYNSHFDAYDDLMVYGSKDFLDKLNNLSPYQGTSIVIETEDFNNLPQTAMSVRESMVKTVAEGRFDHIYNLQTAEEAGASYMNWLAMLDVNVIVILTLMMVVGCVTLVSGMLIIILDKRKFIGILKALGTPSKRLRRIFVFLAIRIALTGLLIGNTLAYIMLLLQDRYHIIPLDPDSYYMDFVPVEISPLTFVFIDLGVILVSYLVLILPSQFVSKISPSESMRDSSQN